MISPRKLNKMSKKWQKVAAGGIRRRISIANKGHFVVYTTDGTRFVIPLINMNSGIYIELFKMSEEVFGLPADGPIILPCDAPFMEYLISLVGQGIGKTLENALFCQLHIIAACHGLTNKPHSCA